MGVAQQHVEAAVLKSLKTSRIEMASKCGKAIQKHLGPVWWDPFMMEPYLLYNFCTKGIAPDVSEVLMTTCMQTNLLKSFYRRTETLHVQEQIVSFVFEKVSTSSEFVSRVHNTLLKVCAEPLDSFDTDRIKLLLQQHTPGTRILIGTSGSASYKNREKDGSVLHPLFRRRKPIDQDILEQQMLFEIVLPIVFLSKNGNYLFTKNVCMLRVALCGPKSHWNRFTLRPKTHGFHYPSFADMVVHLTTPFLTNITDQQRAHASILFLIMSFLHERGGTPSVLSTWHPWKRSLSSDPFLEWGAKRLRWFRDELRRVSVPDSKQFVQRVTLLYNTFVLCLMLNRHAAFPAITYITPQSISDA